MGSVVQVHIASHSSKGPPSDELLPPNSGQHRMMVPLLFDQAQPLAKRRAWGLSGISYLRHQKLAVSLGRSQYFSKSTGHHEEG